MLEYTFRSTEAHQIIRDAGLLNGWKETRGIEERIGLVAAGIGGGVLTLLVLAALALTGNMN